MWNRVEVKSRGKTAFLGNYWKCVVAAIVFSLLNGGVSSGRSSVEYTQSYTDFEVLRSDIMDFIRSPLFIGGAVLSILVGILVINALEVGCNRFFMVNQLKPAELSELGHGFTHNYWNNVGTILLRNLLIVLGTILFIIPGIIMSYQYRMVPYILNEKPELSPGEALNYSKQMMVGNKMDAFIYDLSFFGWYILSAITFGILGIFFVSPYKFSADAELYLAIRSKEIEREEWNA